MELQFQKTEVSYLDELVSENQNLEQTQELKLSDGMPDIGRVLSSWGQVILRSKEWRSDSISVSGGIMVWVMYLPEDESGERVMDAWIPFQMKWNLPDNVPDGKICVDLRLRFVDARTVSPRKIMVRAGIAGCGKAFTLKNEFISTPDALPADVEILKTRCAVHLMKEAGETNFYLDEEMNGLSTSAPLSKPVCYMVNPEVTDKKVLGNKIAFRGNLNLHMLYRMENDKLEAQDFSLPFSQYTELNSVYGSETDVCLTLCTTSLELDPGENGSFHVKCGIAAQYLIQEKNEFEVVEDAYSPYRKLTIHAETGSLPKRVYQGRITIHGESDLPAGAASPVDIRFLPDYPSVSQTEDGLRLEAHGSVRVLYYDENGILLSTASGWEGNAEQDLPKGGIPSVSLQIPQEGHLLTSGGTTLFRAELPVELNVMSGDGIMGITSIELGDDMEPDVSRPSVILRRAGGERLWDIAKASGSTVQAIQKANNLEGEPAQGQMLLIPVS